MPAKRSDAKKPSSGSDPKSKSIVKSKMENAMHEFKHKELESGRSGKKVRNPKQAIAIGLSEARRAGAKIPPSPSKNKASAKKTVTRKTAAKTSAKKAAPAKESTVKKSAARKASSRG